MKKFVKIKPEIVEYDWGNTEFIPNLVNVKSDGKPKAEMWMGTHPGAPSLIYGTDKTLESFLKENTNFFSADHLKMYYDQLPFLFKVLAIEKPLSIQCHPDYREAKIGYENETEFRKNNPRSLWNYKDDNRKAEVILALSPITAMCGFLSDEEIITNLKTYIPNGFDKFISSRLMNVENKAKAAFEYIYTVDEAILLTLISELLKNVKDKENKVGAFFTKEGIINRVKDEYPKDRGLFAPLLLNVAHLNKGESIYLEPRLLHAYVYGNGIELMSASDNVLRGGLTHKKMDVDELLKVMVVKTQRLKLCKTFYDKNNKCVIETPTDEFTLAYYSKGKYDIKTQNIEMLLFIEDSVMSIDKEEIQVKKGDVYVIAANTHLKLDNEGDVFVATC
ncbi:MAG: mannose-6-phosphate isomerase, class I [Pleomorphochaeta sp.]